jgi:hypothetical protein
MEMLKLAIKAGLPLIYVRTDDLINIEEVLTWIADEPVKPLNVPVEISKTTELKVPSGRVHFCATDCKSLVKLYHFCVSHEKTIIFVNTDKSVLHFDGGQLVPPKELIRKFLSEVSDEPDELLPAFGGLTLKDVAEVTRLTMTRDESLTVSGVATTRRGYSNVRGIQQVDTDMSYYVLPDILDKWVTENKVFFRRPKHQSLMPRGLLFDGPPGVGKTMGAKYVAREFGVPLYRLDIGAMKGKYVGDSESNLLAAIAQVDTVEPCVVIFDEVEKIFTNQSDQGVTTSMLSQVLWWLQEHKTKVFSVMTTNNRKIIPSELYREGRIDEVMVFEGVEGLAECLEFSLGAFQTLMDDMKEGYDLAKATKSLKDRIKTAYLDVNYVVPQAKLMQLVYGYVKSMLNEVKS